MRALLERHVGLLLDGEAHATGKAHGAQHPQAILGKALIRISDGSDNSLLNILHTAVGIDDIAVPDIYCHCIDGKVTPL